MGRGHAEHATPAVHGNSQGLDWTFSSGYSLSCLATVS